MSNENTIGVPQQHFYNASKSQNGGIVERCLSSEPRLREISENIIESRFEAVESLKSSNNTANKPSPFSHETESHVNRLLEKLLLERSRVVELEQQSSESNTETSTTTKSNSEAYCDQENRDPEREILAPVTSARKKQAPPASSLEDPQEKNEFVSTEQDVLLKNIDGSEEYLNATLVDKPVVPEVEQDEQAEEQFEEYHDENEYSERNEAWKDMKISDILYVNKAFINYGTTLPGQILEESLEILNKSDESIVVQIIVDCTNAELAESDEYVFAIRRSHTSDYNDKHFIIMSPYSAAQFKLALKVPSTRMKESIRGETIFCVQGLEDRTSVYMETSSIIPKVISPKQLFNSELKCNMIKLAMRNSKKLETRIPLKSDHSTPLTFDLEIFRSEESDLSESFDCTCSPSVLVLAANSMAVVNFTVKPTGNYRFAIDKPKTELVKKVLVAKCRDSSVMYSFVILVEVLA